MYVVAVVAAAVVKGVQRIVARCTGAGVTVAVSSVLWVLGTRF